MKTTLLCSVLSLGLFAGTALAGAKAAGPAKAPPAAAKKQTVWPAATLAWVKPMGDNGPEMAFVSGDAKTGPFQMFLKLKPGAAAGWHTHDAEYNALVVQGSWMHLVQGETTATALPVGSYWTQPAKENHDDRCSADGACMVFITSMGAQTYYPKTADGKNPPPVTAAKTK